MVKDEFPEEEIEDEDYDIDADEVLEVLDFDFERLVVEGKDSIQEQEIEYFDITTQKKERMKVFVKPITRAQRSIIERKISDKKRKVNVSLVELLCEYGWVLNKEGIRIPLEDIRTVQNGAVDAIAEKINYISGQFTDKFEDKWLDRAFWELIDPEADGRWSYLVMLIKGQCYHLQPKISDLTDIQIVFLSVVEKVYIEMMKRQQ